MKTIERIEQAKNQNATLEDLQINRTFYWAYIRTQETKNETINFEDVIWENDVEEIIKHCKEFEISEITISSNYTGLLDIIATFQEQGCVLEGLTKVYSRFTDIRTGDFEVKNAVKIIIK
jgi:hypothetical protein